MANRQNFSRAVAFEIAKRATRPDGQMACEKCGAVGVRLELHHLSMDAMKTDEAKRTRKLTADDGAMWCVSFCHKPETARQRKILAKSDAVRMAHLGIRKRGRGWPKLEPKDRSVSKIAHGPTAFARQIVEIEPENVP